MSSKRLLIIIMMAAILLAGTGMIASADSPWKLTVTQTLTSPGAATIKYEIGLHSFITIQVLKNNVVVATLADRLAVKDDFSTTYNPSSDGVYTINAKAELRSWNILRWDWDYTTIPGSVKSEQLIVDRDSPITTANVASGTLGNNGWYRSDVAVNLTATDAGTGVKQINYAINSGSYQTVYGSQATAFVTTESANNVISFYAIDNSGHAETAKTFTVKIDKTNPTVTGTPSPAPNSNGWNNGPVTVQFSATDALSGISGSPTNSQTVSSDGSGQSVSWTATDVAGNSVPGTVSGINIDSIAPSSSHSLGGPVSNGWYTGTVTLTVSTSDGGSGVQNVEYSVNGGAWIAYTGPTLFSDNGAYNVQYRATDKAGNTESVKTAGFKIDRTAPSTSTNVAGTPGNNGWYTTDVTVGLTATDNTGGSGVRETCYRLNGNGWQTGNSVTVTTQGENHLYYYSTDIAGNQAPAIPIDVKIDRDAPNTGITVTGPLGLNGWYAGPVTVTLSPVDLVSGISGTYYSTNGGSMNSYSGPFQVNADGITAVQFYSIDNAGHLENTRSYDIPVDLHSPALNDLQLSGDLINGWYKSPVTVTITVASYGSDGVTRYYTLDGSSTQTYVNPFGMGSDGSHNVNAWAVDNAGLQSATKSAGFRIDRTAPSISYDPDPATPYWNNWYNQPVTVTFHATDSGSGVRSITPETTLGEGSGRTATGTATDNAGNSNSVTTAGINIDLSAPATTAGWAGTTGSGGWYTSDVVMTLAAEDSLSGVKVIQYSTDNGESWTTYDGAVTFGNEGATTVLYRAIDNVDNVETIQSATFSIDKTTPVSSASLSGTAGTNGWYVSDVTVTISATDSGSSGVQRVEYSLDGSTWTAYAMPVIVSAEGATTVHYRAVDGAGNAESARSVSIRVDKTLPKVTASLTGDTNVNGWFETNVRMPLDASDSLSGISSILYSLDGSLWNVYTDTVTIPLGPQKVVYFSAIDNAGNVFNASRFVYFPPANYDVPGWQQLYGQITPTPMPTTAPPTGNTSTEVPTVTPIPAPVNSPTPTPVPTVTEQTRPNYPLYLLLLALLVGAVGSIYYLFFRAKR